MIFPILIVSSLLLSGISSLSVVNNVTVPSDVLTELFFNEIRDNQDLIVLSTTDTKNNYNAAKCILSLRTMVKQFPSLQVAPFFDAWGKFPSGLLRGNFYDIGNFDQCVRISTTLSSLTGEVSGQYCFASIPFVNNEAKGIPTLDGARVNNERAGLINLLRLIIGICVPDTCDPDLITKVFQLATSNVFGGALSGVYVSDCTNGKKPAYQTMDIVGISIFSTVAGLMILSSIYDFLMSYFGKPPVPVLLAFSILTNGKKLFAINTKRSPNTIDCLTGIRVLSMMWVIEGHSYVTSLVVPMINTFDLFSWYKAPWSMQVLSAAISVDSFLFISGLLVAWLGFKELDKTKGKLNIVMMYVHRYLRLTPPVAAGLLYLFSVNKFIGTGPFRETVVALEGCKNWWPILVHIQNYFDQSDICYPQTWYLAVDFQLYILSPLLLIPMWKWGKKFAPVLPFLAVLSIGCVMATYLTRGYTDFLGFFNSGDKTYTPTHTRYSPWLVGFGLGYFMHINRQKSFRPSKILQLIGWTVSFIIFVSVVFAPHFTIKERFFGTVFEIAMYESLKRVSWAIGLAWITFACHFGFGGIVDTFLSHPFWQPLGRLTYCLYLVHSFVLGINYGIVRTQTYFSDYSQILSYWSTFGMSLIVAIAMSLAFEAPILVLEKVIFGGGKQSNRPQVEGTAPPQIVVEDECQRKIEMSS